MALSAFPKPGQTITTDQFRAWTRQFVSTGASSSTAFAATGDSSGLNVKVAIGDAVIDGILAQNPSIITMPVDAGSGGGLSRIDTLVANLDFSASPIVGLAVLKGTPASTGATAPSLALSGTVVYRWPICDVNVSATASTILAGDVVDRRTFAGDPRIRVQSTLPSNPTVDMVVLY